MNHETQARDVLLEDWVRATLPLPAATLQPLAGDASFRRYFRYQNASDSYVIMDAPPPHENTAVFHDVAEALAAIGLSVPLIIAADLNQGMMILSDLGDTLFHHVLTPQDAGTHYQAAMQWLLQLQSHPALPGVTLPAFDEAFMAQECQRIPDWYVTHYLETTWSPAMQREWQALVQLITTRVAAQPTVVIHRDYHSRNLLVTPAGLVVIDFQDAMRGPLTYDLVSLLKDCYIDWPRAEVVAWVRAYHEQALARGIVNCDPDTFLTWFDWTGLQRHLKCLGIFARLAYRDNKWSYLSYLPRVWGYVNEVVSLYPELAPYNALIATLTPHQVPA